MMKYKDSMVVNILNYEEYLEDGGQLDFPKYIQCLIDSDNVSKAKGNALIRLNDITGKY